MSKEDKTYWVRDPWNKKLNLITMMPAVKEIEKKYKKKNGLNTVP